MAIIKSPLLVFTSFPAEGHFLPVLQLAKHMKKHGYSAIFVADETLRDKVEAAGIEYISTPSIFTEKRMASLLETTHMPGGLEKFARQAEIWFYETITTRVERFHEVLEEIQSRHPAREIVIVEDVYSSVSNVYKMGKPLPKGFDSPPKNIGLGCAPLLIESEDTGPYMMNLPVDSTPSGKMRNRLLWEFARNGPLKSVHDTAKNGFRAAGCTNVDDLRIWNTFVETYNITFQLCSPSMEYKISDIPPSVRFTGVLPRREEATDFDYPEWWECVTTAKTDRRIVFASQGTLILNYEELVIPTIKAFAGQEDVILVATLGRKGATLNPEVNKASNVFVIDYLPYDIILEAADVFISNGGYGALTHGIRNGCPMVIAGNSEEKIEVAARAAYSGVAVSLGILHPTSQKVFEGVQKVLRDSRYRDRAEELRKENEGMDALETMRRGIEGLLG